jgi:hypothetical protein
MLLSPTRNKQKQTTIDTLPKKVSKTSSNQKANSKVIQSSDSDSHDTNETSPRRARIQPMKDLNVKIRYKIKTNDDHPHSPHVNFLQFIINNVFPNVMIMNKRHENLKVAAIMALNTTDIYNNHFDIHKMESRKQDGESHVIIIQTIQTHLTLSNIKKQNGVLDFLKTNGIHISIHEWTPTIWDVKTIGFLTKFSPSHHPKEVATNSFNTTMKNTTKNYQYRLRYTFVQATICNRTVRVPVYAIEVMTSEVKAAEKQIIKSVIHPDEYISFRMRNVNPTAFQNAVALVAQHQNDLRTIVVDNVAEEAYFVLEGFAKQVDKVITVHHLQNKKSMRVITYNDDFRNIRKVIKENMKEWIDNLDPSDIRACGEIPALAPIREDDFSNDSASDLSQGIESLLSLDIYELSLFQENGHGTANRDKPVSEITTTTAQDVLLNQQQQIIEEQMRQMQQMAVLIKETKQSNEKRIEELMQIIDELKKTNEEQKKTNTKQQTQEVKTINAKRRP